MVVRIDPDMADAWINKGRLLDDSGRHQEAVDCYDQALRRAPQDVVGWANRGNSLKALGRTEEALDSYRKALQYDESHAPALFGAADCLMALGRDEEGVAFADRGLRAQPGWASPNSSQARSLRRSVSQ